MAVIHRYWSDNSVEVFCEMSSGIVIRQQMTWWDDPDRKGYRHLAAWADAKIARSQSLVRAAGISRRGRPP